MNAKTIFVAVLAALIAVAVMAVGSMVKIANPGMWLGYAAAIGISFAGGWVLKSYSDQKKK